MRLHEFAYDTAVVALLVVTVVLVAATVIAVGIATVGAFRNGLTPKTFWPVGGLVAADIEVVRRLLDATRTPRPVPPSTSNGPPGSPLSWLRALRRRPRSPFSSHRA